MTKKNRIPHKFHPWIAARKQFKLSDAHIQMARELGLSPKRMGSYADRTKQPWKLPLPEFIETLYEKQFNRVRPEEVKTMEQIAADHVARRAAKKAARAASKLSQENEADAQDAPAQDIAAQDAQAQEEAVDDSQVEADTDGGPSA